MLASPVDAILSSMVEKLSRLIGLKVISSEHLETTNRNQLHETHSLILGALAHAAYDHIGEEYGTVAIERGLKVIGERMFRPDITLWQSRGRLVGVMDYESTNSSDSRIIDRNFENYRKYVGRALHDIPHFWVILTTLPSKEVKSSDWNSWDYSKKNKKYEELRKNPFQFWFRQYKEKFAGLVRKREKCPLYVANLDSNELRVHLPKDVTWAHPLRGG